MENDNKQQYFTRNYWVDRYNRGGDSGFGSHDDYSVKFKGDYINGLIEKYQVKTLFDYGCGDGNQLKAISGYTGYTGYDIASNIIDLCNKIYPDHEDKIFTADLDDVLDKKYDMAISMDVTYHIIEQDLFEIYLKNLFGLSDLVVLFTTNSDSRSDMKHHHPRKVIDFIREEYKDFVLMDVHAYNDNVGFYTYKRI